MLIWIILAAMVAGFTALTIIFLNAILDLYDKVVKGIKKWVMAKKAMRVKRDGTVEATTVTVNEYGDVQVHSDVTSETISIDDIDDPILKEQALNAQRLAKERNKESAIVEAKMDKEVEDEIRRRRSA